MAWLCKRAIAGLQYTPFDIDQPEDYSLRPYLPFASGTDLLRPASHLTSATQQRASKGRLPDVLTERTHHICSQRFRDLLERFDPGVHYFSPFLLKRKNGEKVGDHYLWTPGQDIDCILTAGMDQCREESEERTTFPHLESRGRREVPAPSS